MIRSSSIESFSAWLTECISRRGAIGRAGRGALALAVAMLGTAARPPRVAAQALLAGHGPIAASANGLQRELVAIEEFGVLLIEPTTGRSRARIGENGLLFGAVVGDGIGYISVWTEESNETAVYAVRADAATPAVIDQVPGIAIVSGFAANGRGLRIVSLWDTVGKSSRGVRARYLGSSASITPGGVP